MGNMCNNVAVTYCFGFSDNPVQVVELSFVYIIVYIRIL